MRHFTTDGVEEQFSTNKLNFSDQIRGVALSQEVGEKIFLILN